MRWPLLPIIPLAAAAAASSPSLARAQQGAVSLITGTVRGADGALLKHADVHLFRPRLARRTASAPVGADGRFAIATTDTGALYLEFTGVDHYAARVPLLVGRPGTIALDVRLKHYTYTDSLERVTAIGDWNGFNFGTGRPLARRSDGTYALEVETTADTLAYQLLGLEESGGRSINGTLAAWYVYDNGGDYRSVIRAEHGRATVVFDPRLLVRRADTSRVTFRDPASRSARLYAMLRLWRRVQRAFLDSSRAARARRDSLPSDQAASMWAPVIIRGREELRRERDPVLRELLLLQLFQAGRYGGARDTALARRVINEVPPSSPWWTFYEFGGVQAVFSAFEVVSGRASGPGATPDTARSRAMLTWFERVLAEHPDPMVQAEALLNALFLARGLGDQARANDYYLRLVTDYLDSPNIPYVRSQFAPNRVMRVGNEIPDFRLTALDDSTMTYSKESFRGRIVLLDFWATWCGPCIPEMPYLHAARDSLASSGLEILSVSLDERPQDVRRFREGEWKMPWLHAFVPGGFGDPQMRQLEILFLPRAILIGRDGRILALDGDLRGAALMPTLRRALEAP